MVRSYGANSKVKHGRQTSLFLFHCLIYNLRLNLFLSRNGTCHAIIFFSLLLLFYTASYIFVRVFNLDWNVYGCGEVRNFRRLKQLLASNLRKTILYSLLPYIFFHKII